MINESGRARESDIERGTERQREGETDGESERTRDRHRGRLSTSQIANHHCPHLGSILWPPHMHSCIQSACITPISELSAMVLCSQSVYVRADHRRGERCAHAHSPCCEKRASSFRNCAAARHLIRTAAAVAGTRSATQFLPPTCVPLTSCTSVAEVLQRCERCCIIRHPVGSIVVGPCSKRREGGREGHKRIHTHTRMR